MNTSSTIGKTHLLAFVQNAQTAKSIRAVEPSSTTEMGDITHATTFLKSHPSPHILIVEIENADTAPALLDALADAVHPNTRVIVTGSTDTLSFYNWLIGLGVHDYLLSPISETALSASLKRITHPEPVVKTAPPTHPRHTLAVIGTRGGVGASTIALTLAAIGARDLTLPTVLVDLDMHFGTDALSLDLEASRGMRDALEKPERVDALFLERLMLRPFSPLSILSCEEPLSEHFTPAANAGEVLITTLRENYELTIIDVPRHLDTLTRQALGMADTIIIVCEPTIAALRDTLRLRDYCADILKRTKIHILINREGMHAKYEIPKAEFTKHLGKSSTTHISFVPEILLRTSQGELLLDEPKAAATAMALRTLLQTLLGKELPITKTNKSIGSFFKGKK